MVCRTISLLAVLLALVLVSHVVDGHGVCVDPPTRGTCHSHSINRSKPRNPRIRAMYKPIFDRKCPRHDCPHCLNAGGKGAVIKAAKNFWRPFEPMNRRAPFRRDSGMCGDPFLGDKPHEKGGIYAYPSSPIMKTYKSGSKVQFVVDLTTNHNGFFEFFICDAKKCGGDINERCFKRGHCHQLMRVKNAECESQRSKECGPIDPKHKGRWYVPCRKGGHVGEHFMGGPYMEYQLPVGFATDHAVIQWYWVTANSCNPPGFVEYFERFPMRSSWARCPGDGGALGGRNPSIVKCGGKNFPEEFWNCADIAVTRSGTTPARQTRLTRTQPPRRSRPRPSASPSPTPTRRPRRNQSPRRKKATRRTKAPRRKQKSKRRLKTRKGSRKCAKNWTQCGGRFYRGPRCCNRGYKCVRVNKFYSQCKRSRNRPRNRNRNRRRNRN